MNLGSHTLPHTHTQRRTSKLNYWNHLLLERCVTHDVTPQPGPALRLLSQKQRPPHSCPISPRFSHVSLLLSSITKPDCVLVIPLQDKEPLSLGYKVLHLSPISSSSLRGFLYDGRPLPVLTHHKPARTQPTQSSRALPNIIGSLRLDLPTFSAGSMEHCTISILGSLEANRGAI